MYAVPQRNREAQGDEGNNSDENRGKRGTFHRAISVPGNLRALYLHAHSRRTGGRIRHRTRPIVHAQSERIQLLAQVQITETR